MSAVEEPSRQTVTSSNLPRGTSETKGREGDVEVQCVLEPGRPVWWEAMPLADRWENHGFSSSGPPISYISLGLTQLGAWSPK